MYLNSLHEADTKMLAVPQFLSKISHLRYSSKRKYMQNLGALNYKIILPNLKYMAKRHFSPSKKIEKRSKNL